MANYLVLSSTSKNNLELANQIGETFTKAGAEVKVIDLEALSLPLYSETEEKNGIPVNASYLTDEIKKASGVFVCAPEYNGGVPPILSNAVAWASRSGDADWRSAFSERFFSLATNSGGPGAKVLLSMREMFVHLGAVVLPRVISCSSYNPVKEKSLDAVVGAMMKFTK